MATTKSIEQIRTDEGFSNKAEHILLKDGTREKNLTVGHGYNLSQSDAREDLLLAGIPSGDLDALMTGDLAISEEQADALLHIQLQQAQRDVKELVPNYDELPQTVQDVFLNMSYQMGKTRLAEFDQMIAAAKDRDWPTVKKEMLNSIWAKQTPSRAKRLSKQIDGVDVEQKAPTTSVGKQLSASEMFKQEQRADRVRRISEVMGRKSLVDRIARQLSKPQEEEQVATESAKPALQKLEQGLFEDESGKKFFVDDKNRLLEIGEDNQPKAVIDPSNFDMSKVESTNDNGA